MEEIWKDITGYKGLYQISSLGRVKSSRHDIILKTYVNRGYHQVHLSKNNIKSSRTIHRLVAEASIPNPENKPQVNHIDEDKSNNSMSNLNWMTAKENSNHGTRSLRVGVASGKTRSKPVKAINVTSGVTLKFESAAQCAKILSVSQGNVTRTLKGRSKTVGGYYVEYL